MTDSIEFFKKESWGVRPVLDVPNQFPPAVMFSILDSDPRPKYRDILNRRLEVQKEQKLEPSSPLTPHQMRQGLITSAWDSAFHDVPGDKVGLLYRNFGRQVSSEAASQEATPLTTAYVVGIVSTEPAGTRYLVTRASHFEDRVVCWCIPVEVDKGKHTDVMLTVQNMIDLETM
jgi:hypothetical protein